MSDENILDVKELFGKFKSTVELKNYSKEIFIKLQVAVKKLKEQEAEINHLRTLLQNSNQFEIIPSEQLTCEMELRRLEESARSRPLSLEEAKIFDIMTKNLIAIKKAKAEEKKPPKTIDADEDTLLSIVHKNDDK